MNVKFEYDIIQIIYYLKYILLYSQRFSLPWKSSIPALETICKLPAYLTYLLLMKFTL